MLDVEHNLIWAFLGENFAFPEETTSGHNV